MVHEFSTIEGVKEDVTEIVLNLKGIAAKLYTDGPKTVRVEAVGPCEVTADNIKQGDDIEILNPEWHIATLGEGGKLVMELTFDKGRGYVPAERNKQAIVEKNDINTLPVDSIYTPVLKVNYNVENTRVGQAIDYDKLTIEVWTDGTINAQEAVSLAARVLTEHVNLFSPWGRPMSLLVLLRRLLSLRPRLLSLPLFPGSCRLATSSVLERSSHRTCPQKPRA